MRYFSNYGSTFFLVSTPMFVKNTFRSAFVFLKTFILTYSFIMYWTVHTIMITKIIILLKHNRKVFNYFIGLILLLCIIQYNSKFQGNFHPMCYKTKQSWTMIYIFLGQCYSGPWSNTGWLWCSWPTLFLPAPTIQVWLFQFNIFRTL